MPPFDSRRKLSKLRRPNRACQVQAESTPVSISKQTGWANCAINFYIRLASRLTFTISFCCRSRTRRSPSSISTWQPFL
jgi:hypothetical protein